MSGKVAILFRVFVGVAVQVTAKKENDDKMLYEVLFPHLADGSLSEAIQAVSQFKKHAVRDCGMLLLVNRFFFTL